MGPQCRPICCFIAVFPRYGIETRKWSIVVCGARKKMVELQGRFGAGFVLRLWTSCRRFWC